MLALRGVPTAEVEAGPCSCRAFSAAGPWRSVVVGRAVDCRRRGMRMSVVGSGGWVCDRSFRGGAVFVLVRA